MRLTPKNTRKQTFFTLIVISSFFSLFMYSVLFLDNTPQKAETLETINIKTAQKQNPPLPNLSGENAKKHTKKQLTIINRSVVPLRVYVDRLEDTEPSVSIGFVDPGKRETFKYPLKLGRWYVKIRGYSPKVYLKLYKFSLYVKQEKPAYVYEVHNRDFSNKPIPPTPNVSILGTWTNKRGLATRFRKEGDFYKGTLVSVPDSFAKFGYSSGMEWITVKRTDFDLYKGTRIKIDSKGVRSNVKFSCQVEKGNELFPHNWFRR